MSLHKIKMIRREEKKYHDYCYENYTLFEEGSWLAKPVKSVIDLLPHFTSKHNINVLDLGSGVGRNSIPIAKEIKDRNGNVVCVDLLESALHKLKEYSKEHEVEDIIKLEQADIGDYYIEPDSYDLIVAVSALEHVISEAVFDKVIERMVKATKQNGINCVILNSEMEEIHVETNEKLDALMELNLPTDYMLEKLSSYYVGWEVLNKTVKPLEYEITRDNQAVLLKTNAITYVVRKQ